MEAARISALRGHKVTIFEKTGELGGAMLCCCTVPGKSKMRWHADWLRQQVEKLGIEVKYRTEPKAKDFEGRKARHSRHRFANCHHVRRCSAMQEYEV
jgi:NADPH-dependent 2,4-dienoyl-CoA reductase/sulfur reductase-like enzyme